ncbi:uncharacterized protein NECHADRAFT_104883 [Fusarium vanettenii 77-13-4]|uniref:Uncharacterized protein n=1 Tax=Fusarium vanettenii (strain ATCC MYA-4622 / CBS 123669 / FGSC 9596 / NRRL 45880 / 77-13-4) TaxID=660122 RepID=C7ZMZ0_FUSV7|nr:uncharacterized protein NECHADRAFT_104883 [Fusarium vanettenii 77-13-4]EEU34599.1 hypothetical protein NECHADRAFT_104883 [Fusarium vanettenii 77-13-4]
MGASISVVSNPETVANAIFTSGVSVTSASWNTGFNQNAVGTFTNGPLGVASGGILTTGGSKDAAAYQAYSVNIENGAGASQTYCGGDSLDAAVLSVDIEVQQGFNGVEVEFVFASEEYSYQHADPIGIFLDGEQFALNPDGSRITAKSYYLSPERAIKNPNQFLNYPSWSTYAATSKPLIMGIAAAPGAHTMVFAICDAVDGQHDSALFVRAKGCKDCVADVKIHYLTQTTTVASTFTSTIEPVSSAAGTVLIGVTVDPTTTATSSEPATTTSSELFTTETSTDASTATSTEFSSTSTEDSTRSTDASATSSESSAESLATTTAASDSSTVPTTDPSVSTTTATTDSSITTLSQVTTTSTIDSTMTTLTTSRRGPCRPA